MRKGQLTIEYLIILVIILMLFNGISLDLIDDSLEHTLVLQTSEMIYSAKLLINSTINNFYLQGSGAAKTISLRAPPDCVYFVSEFLGDVNNITVNCLPESPSANLTGFTVGPSISGIKYNCITCPADRIEMNKLELVKIEKT